MTFDTSLGFSIDDLRTRARSRLPKGLFEFVDRGTEDETALRRNRDGFDALSIRPRVLVDVAGRSSSVALFGQTHAGAQGTSDEEQERNNRKLAWAAGLHEIGAQISHSDHHKHGAYILDNVDAMGFSLAELHRLSLLVLGHRGKLRKLKADFDDDTFVRQLLSLRLAIILCHARREPDTAGLRLARDPARGFVLTSRPGWAAAYPQSAHLLREEIQAWQKTPWSFRFNGA